MGFKLPQGGVGRARDVGCTGGGVGWEGLDPDPRGPRLIMAGRL